MARPKKKRHVCVLPDAESFGPLCSRETYSDVVEMTVEEFESIRLIDLERLTQQESAEAMGVARSTIQRIYDDARQKLADSLVNGKVIVIKGGDYKVCEKHESEKYCKRQGCCRRAKEKDDNQ